MGACAEAGPILLAAGPSPYTALSQWIERFIDFLITKHGLAAVMRSDHTDFQPLHDYLLDRLVPVCAQLLSAAAQAGEVRADIQALELTRGVGSRCIGVDGDFHYDGRCLVGRLMAGLAPDRCR